MPDDVSVAQPADPVSDHEWSTYRWVWELFYVLATVAIGAGAWLVADDVTDSVIATAGLAALAAWYLAYRRLLLRDDLTSSQALVFRLGVLVLFIPTVIASDVATYLLFVLVAVVYDVTPLRHAIPIVVALNFVPVLSALARGATSQEMMVVVLVAMVTGTASVVIGVTVYRVVEQNFVRAELIAQLHASQAENERLSRQAGVVAERERLSAELHDTVSQGLSSIILLLQSARTTADAGTLDERLRLAERTARANLAETRELVSGGDASRMSIDDDVRQLAERHGARFVRAGEPRALPAPAAVLLLRSAQEGLANVGKHAQGAEVEIAMDYGGGEVSVRVRDTGPGFDPGAPASGYGLSGMRNRARGLGGTCTVDSAPGRGTTVIVAVPVASS
ncbi:MAG: sensor histidine kinase [Stackebrandtia sp.]